MSQSYPVQQKAPEWWLEAPEEESCGMHPESRNSDVLRLGKERIRLDDIVSYKLDEVTESNRRLRFAIGGLLAAVAVGFIVAGFSAGALERALMAFVFAVLVGMAVATEALGFGKRTSLRLTVFSETAEPVSFHSSEAGDIDRLASFLRQIARV